MKRLIIISAIVLAVLLIYLNTAPEKNRLLQQAPTGQDIELQSVDGVFRLSSHNKLALIYFGYSFCPDICPTSLAVMTQVFNAMNEDELNKTIGIFISVDPDRDSLTHLKDYVQFFHPNIIGLTGAQDKIDPIVKNYGASYKRVEGESAGGYVIDHTSFLYLVTPEGKIIQAFPHGTQASVIYKTISSELSQFKFSS